tara:strand:- start:3960 stop:4394 length:435 start_codon:yes stop_codon:yes gene_type:complete
MDKFRNNIDLMYLTNDLIKYKKNDKIKDENINEKYNSLIQSSTKKLLKKEFISEKINESFQIFVNNVIENDRFVNRQQIIQQQYKNMDKEKKKKKYVPINIDQLDINMIVKKETKTIDLKTFLKKKKKKSKIVMPKKHDFNIII